MTQKSFHWDGASVGDADTYTVNAADGIGYRLSNEDYASPFVDTGIRMLFNGDENRGVLSNWLNELEVTGVATPVSINTGGAIVYGMPYENATVPVTVAVPSPTNDTRQDRIVLRRDWAAQTIRITRIAGVEGGGVPAMTQSPAPAGSGIYDVPLASLSVTTGGVITVTDEREYCQFGTVPRLDTMSATQLTNSSIDWSDRATRTCKIWLLGGDFLPIPTATSWNYDTTGSAIGFTLTPTWAGASNTQGWRTNGAVYSGIHASFTMPPNWVPGTGWTSTIWWTCNSGIASTVYVRSDISMWSTDTDSDPYGTFTPLYYQTGAYKSTYVNETLVLSDWYQTTGSYIPADASGYGMIDYPNHYDVTFGYLIWYYNSAGAEDISFLGVDIDYTGYV